MQENQDINWPEMFEAFSELKICANEDRKKLIIQALLNLPVDLIDEVMKKCFYVCKLNDDCNQIIPSRLIGEKSIIFLSDDVFDQPKEKILFIILCQTAHVLLDHKSQSCDEIYDDEIIAQEDEAKKFAKLYFNI
ncbi:MAG: hypothetical protein PHQ98_01300 [Candidatus ainarchaeum sp.]|nr:hypothetical protein [Candidatus ainarchaeum sp.]